MGKCELCGVGEGYEHAMICPRVGSTVGYANFQLSAPMRAILGGPALARTPLSEYSEDELIEAAGIDAVFRYVRKHDHIAVQKSHLDRLHAIEAHYGQVPKNAGAAKKSGPSRDKFYVSDPETYHSDWD